ncbi:MAG TPA: hypothetical protein VNE38_08700 [Ktedonobacteraceae bacterium]|nr:hypothetical protein [Ktedonobacteraceae bacterium]
MRSQLSRHKTPPSLLLKCGGIFFLFLLTVIVAACGGSGGQTIPGTPVATLTVVFGQFQASPTAPLAPYYCGGWATDTSPAYSPNSVVNIYGKFTQTISGNPVGVGGASVTATVLWPDTTNESETVKTSSDGLAVFTITIQASAINHVVLVEMTFTSPSGYVCKLTSPAFFTAIQISPTATAVPSSTNTLTPTGSPSVTPSPGGTLTPTGSPNTTPTPTG